MRQGSANSAKNEVCLGVNDRQHRMLGRGKRDDFQRGRGFGEETEQWSRNSSEEQGGLYHV